jgi:predicted phage tail protein
VPDITTSIYPMLQYLDAELETRTGLAKQSQGIDTNALRNQSATAVAQVFSASQMRIKLIARLMAGGVRDMRADFQHLRRWRKSVEQAQSYTFKAVITVIVTGFVGAVWLGVKAVLGK